MTDHNHLGDRLIDGEREQLVPVINPTHTDVPLKLHEPPSRPITYTRGDCALVTIYLGLCSAAFVSTFLPITPSSKSIQTGDVISAGLILDGLSANQTLSEMNVCAEPYNSMCSGISEDGLLKRHQTRLLRSVAAELKRMPQNEAGRLFALCSDDRQSRTVLNTTVAERWARGQDVDGIRIESSANPFTASNEKHLFVVSDLARRGVRAIGPYDSLSRANCPAGMNTLIHLAQFEPSVAPYLLKTIYTDNSTLVCKYLSALNITTPIQQIITPLDALACAHTVGSLFPNLLAHKFNGTQEQFKLASATFKELVMAMQSVFADNTRISKKLQAIRLYKWPSVYKEPIRGPLFNDSTWLSWYTEHKTVQWRHGMTALDDAQPMMMPWEVNAFYAPSKNRVFVPPGLLSICPGETSLPFWSGTVSFIIAHEVSHSIDPMSIHFDPVGKYSPVASADLPHGYDAAIECLKQNAIKRGVHPYQTLGESFADAMGWFTVERTITGTEWSIKMLGFSSNVAAAQAMLARTWCTAPINLRAWHSNYSLWHDEHPPSPFRVDNTLATNAGAGVCNETYLKPCMSLIDGK